MQGQHFSCSITQIQEQTLNLKYPESNYSAIKYTLSAYMVN